MTENELIELLKRRAADPTTQYDFANRWPQPLPMVASPAVVAEAEGRLGFRLFPLHRRVLLEVANGGFGPGASLYGLEGGFSDPVLGGAMLEIRAAMWTGDGDWAMPPTSLPLCDWGCGQWSWIESATGDVLTCTEAGNFLTGYRFADWLAEWARGTNLYQELIQARGEGGVPAGRRYIPPK